MSTQTVNNTVEIVEKQDAGLRNLFATGNAIFKLLYKKGRVLNDIHFVAKNKEDAIKRGHTYCTRRKLHFVHVIEWLHDIDEMPNPDSITPP